MRWNVVFQLLLVLVVFDASDQEYEICTMHRVIGRVLIESHRGQLVLVLSHPMQGHRSISIASTGGTCRSSVFCRQICYFCREESAHKVGLVAKNCTKDMKVRKEYMISTLATTVLQGLGVSTWLCSSLGTKRRFSC